MVEGRCMKCRKQVEIKEGIIIPIRNNNMMKGICPYCGTKVGRILKKEKHEDNTKTG